MVLLTVLGLCLVKGYFANIAEPIAVLLMRLAAIITLLGTVGIFLSVIFETINFFSHIHPLDFLFGTHWNPQAEMENGKAVQIDGFGAVPIFAGTAMITVIALLFAAPVGMMSAIYLSEYSNKYVRKTIKPVLEILAGIPTVVYGFFAALNVAPFIKDLTASIGLHADSESAIAAGLVMGIMILPLISSLCDDVISAIPNNLREGAIGLGATKSESIKQIVLPAALPGIAGAILLATSRAIGETMIVVMAAGLAANLTANPLSSVTTVTVQIVMLLTGDDVFDNPRTLSAFALGFVLFVTTLVINYVALRIVKKYKEQYE